MMPDLHSEPWFPDAGQQWGGGELTDDPMLCLDCENEVYYPMDGSQQIGMDSYRCLRCQREAEVKAVCSQPIIRGA